jgi:hypothetical protein
MREFHRADPAATGVEGRGTPPPPDEDENEIGVIGGVEVVSNRGEGVSACAEIHSAACMRLRTLRSKRGRILST